MRKRHAVGALILLTAAVMTGGLAMLRKTPATGAGASPSAVPLAQAAVADASQELFQRCSLAMLQDTCGVMKKTSSASSKPATQVFVAGAGEVDAAVYERLRSQGDEMCGEVLRECRLAWDGTACGIARALYPELR